MTWLDRLLVALGAPSRFSMARRRGRHNRLGARGEREARRMLRDKGYRIIASNARTAAGEADIVCRAPEGVHVIVEVKSRICRTGAEMPAECAVNHDKRRRLARVAALLSRANGWQGARVDVVAVEWPQSGRGRPEIRHYVDAGA